MFFEEMDLHAIDQGCQTYGPRAKTGPFARLNPARGMIS